MEMEIHGPLSDDQRADVGRMKRNQQYLLMLVNNVLAFMKAGSGQVPFDITAVSVEATLKAVDELIRPQIEAKGVRFERCGPVGDVRVQADADKLQQVLLNLTRNSVDAMRDGLAKERGIAVVTERVERGGVRIAVTDRGHGVSPQLADDIFHPFVTTKRDGLGVGLAISKTIVESYGGTLSYADNPVGGSIFSIELPAEQPQELEST